jgi:electron transfer flavoprotein beta subunit
MNIIVPIKQVPDLVEALQINEEGTDLDRDWLSFVLNEFDDHALEEALLLKEAHGGTLTVIGVDTTGELNSTLYTTIAKGADRAIKIVGDFEGEGMDSHTMARLLAGSLQDMSYDLILTGVQAADDRDGQLAPLLAGYLDLPHVGVVTGVQINDGSATVHKELWAGIMAEIEVDLPAVIGVQAARQAPRYTPVSRVRQAMQTARIEEVEAEAEGEGAGSHVRHMYLPEKGAGAEFIAGDEAEIAQRIVEILAERGLL